MVKSLTIPPAPEDLIVDLCVNSASSLPPKEEQSGSGCFCPDIRNQSVRCLFAAFFARKYKPCLSRAGDDCGNMHSDFFFFQMKAHLGIGHSKHGTSCMYAKLLVPKCRVFWTLQSLGSCLKKKNYSLMPQCCTKR